MSNLLKLTRLYYSRHCMVEGKYITPEQFCQEILDALGESREEKESRDLVWKEIVDDLSPFFDGPAARYEHPIWSKIRYISGNSTIKRIEEVKKTYKTAKDNGQLSDRA